MTKGSGLTPTLWCLAIALAALAGCGKKESAPPVPAPPKDPAAAAGGSGLSPIGAAQLIACKNNLRMLALAFNTAAKVNGELPSSVEDLFDDQQSGGKILVCPADREKGGAAGNSYGSIFDLAKPLPPNLPSNAMLFWDNSLRHDGGRCVSRLDASVVFMEEADFQQRLAELRTALQQP